jgi:hypothetical protein
MTEIRWVDLITYASGFEADIALVRLDAEGIPARRDNHDTIGIFGPGFQGPNAFGYTIKVPLDHLDDARAVLADVVDDTVDDEVDDGVAE